jgi:hypothetical protein
VADIIPTARRHADRARRYCFQSWREMTLIGLDALKRPIERASDGAQRRGQLLPLAVWQIRGLHRGEHIGEAKLRDFQGL